jgi:glycosyltransferase involved in cell wall biosynthesis
MVRVSVVVPTYDEPAIGALLDRLEPHLAPFGGEVVIVDDSSDIAHRALIDVASAPRRIAVRVLRGEHRGKGDAVRIGMLAARGAIVFNADADLGDEQFALIPRFVQLIEEGHDLVIAERRSRWQYRNLGRFILSIGLFVAQRFFIFQSTRFFDTQCGFKAFRADAARTLASKQTVRGGMFDIEYLYAAVKNGMRIAQVPVPPMRELRESRVRLLSCLVHDPVDLLRVKWNGVRGRYTR